jgi:hypothetical protein
MVVMKFWHPLLGNLSEICRPCLPSVAVATFPGKQPMTSLQLDEASGRYRIRFNYGQMEYKRSIKTKDAKIANGTLARVEETLRLIGQGRIELPADADPATFILSDRKLQGKPTVRRALTLAELFDEYRAKPPTTLILDWGGSESGSGPWSRT